MQRVQRIATFISLNSFGISLDLVLGTSFIAKLVNDLWSQGGIWTEDATSCRTPKGGPSL